MTPPEILELGSRGKRLLQRAYGRDGRNLYRSYLFVGDVLIKVSSGVFSIIVKFETKDLIVYIETPNGEYIGPPSRKYDLRPVLYALEILRNHMVLDDLAKIPR